MASSLSPPTVWPSRKDSSGNGCRLDRSASRSHDETTRDEARSRSTATSRKSQPTPNSEPPEFDSPALPSDPVEEKFSVSWRWEGGRKVSRSLQKAPAGSWPPSLRG